VQSYSLKLSLLYLKTPFFSTAFSGGLAYHITAEAIHLGWLPECDDLLHLLFCDDLLHLLFTQQNEHQSYK